MKTVNQLKVDVAVRLFETINARKEIEKLEAELKEQIKEILGDETILEAGDIFISMTERSRTDLDKKAIQQQMGLDFLKQFEKTTTFKMMNVVKK